MATNEYNTNTGVKLNPNESYVNTQGQTITQGSNIPISAITPIQGIDLSSTFPIPNSPTILPELPTIPDAPVQTQANDLSTLIADLSGQTAGKAVDTLNTANDPNVIASKNEANRLADLYKTTSVAYDQSVENLADPTKQAGDRNIRADIVFGQQAEGRRQKVLALEKINTDYQVATGNYTRALESAQKIVNLKYAPIEEKLAIKKAQLEAIQPMLTEAQKKQSEKQAYALKKEEQKIADQKQIEKDNNTLASDYAKYAIDAGQSQLASQITSLDKASPTFKQDLAKLQSQIKNPTMALDIAIKQANLDKIRKETRLLGEPTAKEVKETAAALKNAKASAPAMQDKIDAVDALLSSGGLANRVGTSFLSRTPTGEGFFGTIKKGAENLIKVPLTLGLGTYKDVSSSVSGSSQAFAGGVHKLVSGLTLDSLIAAKARGATFGALSEGELNILANSASAINDWEIKDSKGKGTGVWNIDEGTFKEELKTIQNLTRKALTDSQGQLLTSDEQSLMNTVFSPDNMALDPANYY